ncbi:MAG: CAP domain-containing protein, partial [Lachnospiraceae bacterium]|nr:CAP domain-containing protein [Lachnospiraceae bacterium]
LLWSEALYQIAAQRVMEISNDYSHNQCPDWVAENILMGTSRPDLAVQIWYDSTGHRRNMLAGWTYGAIANYGSFWVSIFSMVEAP